MFLLHIVATNKSVKPTHYFASAAAVNWTTDPVHSAHYNLTPAPVKRRSCGLMQPLHRASVRQLIATLRGLCRLLQMTGLQTQAASLWPPALCHGHHHTHRLLMGSSSSSVILMSGFIKVSAHAGGPCHRRVYIPYPV